jgi:hypothetical protein
MPDLRAVALLAKMLYKKDDSILRAVAAELESEGITVRESTLYLDNLLAPAGVLTRRKPSKDEQKDIEFGWETAKEIGRLDIGQTVVVKDQTVLAVEAIEGTDEAIRRGLCGQGAVGEDLQATAGPAFDLPVWGTTIIIMREVNASAWLLKRERPISRSGNGYNGGRSGWNCDRGDTRPAGM